MSGQATADPEPPDIDIEMESTEPPRSKRPLEAFRVDHASTIGLSWDAIDALRPPYIIDGFLRRGGVMLLGAESKSRKSWLAQDAGFSVASGLPWLPEQDGQGGFQTAPATVHVLDLELDRSEMLFRFAKARGNRFPDDLGMQHAVSAAFISYTFDGMGAVDILARLEEIKATVKPGDLVIVDCFYRLVPDGNEVAQVADALEILKRFAADTQCGIILVDHFRKAGDDKARNRFAGSFVKLASAGTLVAIEVAKDGTLALNIDARSFHGNPVVHARFELDSYTFASVPEGEMEANKEDRKKAEQTAWIVSAWKHRDTAATLTASDASSRWGVSRQASSKRMQTLAGVSLVQKQETAGNRADEWQLTPLGRLAVMEANAVAA